MKKRLNLILRLIPFLMICFFCIVNGKKTFKESLKDSSKKVSTQAREIYSKHKDIQRKQKLDPSERAKSYIEKFNKEKEEDDSKFSNITEKLKNELENLVK